MPANLAASVPFVKWNAVDAANVGSSYPNSENCILETQNPSPLVLNGDASFGTLHGADGRETCEPTSRGKKCRLYQRSMESSCTCISTIPRSILCLTSKLSKAKRALSFPLKTGAFWKAHFRRTNQSLFTHGWKFTRKISWPIGGWQSMDKIRFP